MDCCGRFFSGIQNVSLGFKSRHGLFDHCLACGNLRCLTFSLNQLSSTSVVCISVIHVRYQLDKYRHITLRSQLSSIKHKTGFHCSNEKILIVAYINMLTKHIRLY